MQFDLWRYRFNLEFPRSCKWRLFDTSLRINNVCEAKLKEVNDHEREQHQEIDGRMQLTTHIESEDNF